jgi:hypothetical protein
MSTDSPDTPRPEATVDASQARLLERLRAAGGGPVSFAELRSLGIENPAVLAYELDLVGMPIERVHHYDAPGRAVPVGVRIDEADGPTAACHQHPPPGQPTQRQLSRAPRRPREAAMASERLRALIPVALGLRSIAQRAMAAGSITVRTIAERSASVRAVRSSAARSVTAGAAKPPALIAPIALVVVAAAIALLALTSQAGRRVTAAKARTDIASHRVSHAVPGRAGQAAQPPLAPAPPARESKGTSTQETAAGAQRADRPEASQSGSGAAPEQARVASPSSPASAAQLQADGHQLLGDGRYAAAIGDLRAALAASGQSVASCAVPASETCLTYAYALYDLGHALRLSGDPGAAVGVLGERLQIDNQVATVREELDLARAAASAAGAAALKQSPAPTLDGGVRAPGSAKRERHGP